MPVTFRSASTGIIDVSVPSATSISVAAPAGVTSGDVLLAFLGGNGTNLTPPAGWTQVSTPRGGYSLYSKIATASEPANYTFTLSRANDCTVLILDYSGASIDTATSGAPGGTHTSQTGQPITTTVASETVVAFFGINVAEAITVGVTNARAAASGTYAYGSAAGDYTGPVSPGSSTPAASTVSSNAGWFLYSVTLLPQLPQAPTLTAPVSGAYLDLANNGGTFSWTYNTGGATGGETGYKFRRKASGGSYSYWNGTGFQGTETTVTSTALSITFASGLWTDGTAYSWSVASQDANGTGPYAADMPVNAQQAPSVAISAPTGTVTTTQKPTVTWSDTLASGGAQSSYRVVTYSQAQYSAGGFAPGSGPSMDDSGVVVSTVTSYTLANFLLNGNYRAYVQIVQSPGGQSSPWVFSGFTQGVSQPSAPSITATAGTDGTTGCPRIALTVSGSGSDTITILRSDGVYVRNASTGTPAADPSTVYDFEAVPGVAYTYTAQALGTSGPSNGFYSPTSTSAAAMLATGQGWWQLDPTNPSTAINAQAIQWNPSVTEQAAAHMVLGQKTMNIYASVVQNTDMSATMEIFSASIYNGLLTLITSQKTLWFSDPYGLGPYYFRVAIAPGGMSSGSGSKVHDTQLMPSTAAGPHRTVSITGVSQPRPPV